MRAMSTVFKESGTHMSRASSLNRLNLAPRTILIVRSLDHHHRHLNLWQILFNVPGAKPRVKPDLIPPSESALYIASMIPLQPAFPCSPLIVFVGPPNPLHSKI